MPCSSMLMYCNERLWLGHYTLNTGTDNLVKNRDSIITWLRGFYHSQVEFGICNQNLLQCDIFYQL